MLVMTNACTPEMTQQLNDFKLSDYVHEYKVLPEKEVLIARAFVDGLATDSGMKSSRDIMGDQSEEIAQESLSHDPEGLATVWTNEFYGEMTFYPGRNFKQGQQECRGFKVTWIQTGTGVFEHKKYGKACLNQVTKRWEWLDI